MLLRLTAAPTSKYAPSLTIDSNDDIHIAWNDDRDGNQEIYYTKLDNNGNTLIDDMRLTFSADFSEHPSISADLNNNIHIVWSDARDFPGTSYKHEIYYTQLDNNGNTLMDDTRLTFDPPSSPSYSFSASLANDLTNSVHVAWIDDRDYPDIFKPEIYYKKYTNFAPIITSLPITSAIIGQNYTYDVEAVDIENGPITYSLIKFPHGMTIDSSTGLIQWTPTFPPFPRAVTGPSNNEIKVTVQVSDGKQTSVQEYTITLIPTRL